MTDIHPNKKYDVELTFVPNPVFQALIKARYASVYKTMLDHLHPNMKARILAMVGKDDIIDKEGMRFIKRVIEISESEIEVKQSIAEWLKEYQENGL